MSKQHWKSVVFIDLDYTIMRSAIETIVTPVVEGEIAQKTGKSIAELDDLITAELSKRHSDPSLPVTIKMDWDDILCTIADRLGVRLQSSPSRAIKAHIGTPQMSLYDGVREVLNELSTPERAVVLATDGLRKYQIPILEGFDLMSHFDEVLTPDSSNALKKVKEFFGDWPSKTDLQIMVGDRYKDDIGPAQKHGFKTVWTFQLLCTINPSERPEIFHWITEGQQGKPDAIIFSLKELPGVVTELERKYLESI
jgi:FMN phosphatase YigB (HAD superfamily)